MNLDEMIQEVALYIGEIVPKNGTIYTGLTPKKIVSGINYAINKIVNGKFSLYAVEKVTLDNKLSFNISTLTNKFVRVEKLTDSYQRNIDYKIYNGTSIVCPNLKEGDILTLEYKYKPVELSLDDISVAFPLPEQNIDPRIVCFFAAYFYYDTNGDDRGTIWLDKWNDGYSDIRQPCKFEPIIDVYGGNYDY